MRAMSTPEVSFTEGGFVPVNRSMTQYYRARGGDKRTKFPNGSGKKGIRVRMFSTTPDQLQGMRELLRQRSGPALYIFDQNYELVLSSSGPEVPPDVQRTVRVARADIETPADGAERVYLLESGLIARVRGVDGKLGHFTAVLTEPFRARNHLDAGRRKYKLTLREFDVLRRMMAGKSTSEIGADLGIAASTVAIHVRSLLTKTASHTRAEMIGRIVAHAAERG
jgi:DNA-binding CsgD family transcriptional regulator